MLDPSLRCVNRVARCYTLYRGQQLNLPALPGSGQLYLMHAHHHPGDTQDQFAKEICVDKTTVAHQLRALEKAGYIDRRAAAADGRCRCIYLTKKGEAAIPFIQKVADDFSARLLENFTPAELDELTRLTAKLYDNAQKLIERAPQGGQEK